MPAPRDSFPREKTHSFFPSRNVFLTYSLVNIKTSSEGFILYEAFLNYYSMLASIWHQPSTPHCGCVCDSSVLSLINDNKWLLLMDRDTSDTHILYMYIILKRLSKYLKNAQSRTNILTSELSRVIKSLTGGALALCSLRKGYVSPYRRL